MMKCWAGEGVQSCSPTIVTDSGQVDFSWGIARPTAEPVAADSERLGASPDGFYPLTDDLEVALPDGLPGGELEGFDSIELRGRDEEIPCVL